MAFQVSPGVQVKEIDLTNVVPAVSSTTGAIAGSFQWGPVDEVVTISDQKGLVENFHEPANNDGGAEDYYSAEGFLRYGSSLRVVRINSTGLYSANSAGHATSLVKNNDEYVETYRDGSQASTVGNWVSRYPGLLGNSLKVSLCSTADAYYKDNAGTTAGNNAFGATAVTTVANASTLFKERDIISFDNHNQDYRITSISGTTLNIVAIGQPSGTGLTSAVDGSGTAVNINRKWEFHDSFDKAPGTSPSAAQKGASLDECHVVVSDENGVWTGTPNSVLETYAFVSLASDAKDAQGASNYYRDVIANKSEYVYWAGHFSGEDGVVTTTPAVTAVYNTATSASGTFTLELTDGTTTVSVSSASYSDVGSQVSAIQGATGYSSLLYTVTNDGTNLILTYKAAGAVSPNPTFTKGGASVTVNVTTAGANSISTTSAPAGTHDSAAEHRTLAQAIADPFGVLTLPLNASLSGGKNGFHPTAGQKYGAWQDHFADAETVDISFLIVGSTRTSDVSGNEQDIALDWTTLANQAILITEARKDCMAIMSPRKSDVVDVSSESTQASNVITTANSASSSSYAVIDSGWLYIYDRYNDRYCWVPGNGHTAGIMARSDLLRDPWFSPAGFSRGQYLGVTKLAFNPSQSSRDDLYRARVNPIVTFPGQGTVLFGDKTMLTSPSAFDRINVRRLFIVLEKAIATAAKAQLFEFNDAFTRAQFRAAVEPFLRDVKNRRGLIDFTVLCDETNNTDTVIDRNEFVCSIFVKPNRSINFITLNFVAARSGVEFSEIYGAV